MRRNIFTTVLLTLCIGFTGFSQEEMKVGYTNIELIMSYMPDVKSIEQELQLYKKKLTESLESKQKYYNAKMQEYYSLQQEGKLTEEKEKELRTEMAQLEQEFEAAQKAADKRMNAKRDEILSPLQGKIQTAIDAVAEENDFDYIINNSSGTGISTLLYGLEKFDVTALIAAKLEIELPEQAQTINKINTDE